MNLKYRCYYEDKAAIHRCDGDTVNGNFLLWTLCDIDVPAGEGFRIPSGEEETTCPRCLQALQEETP